MMDTCLERISGRIFRCRNTGRILLADSENIFCCSQRNRLPDLQATAFCSPCRFYHNEGCTYLTGCDALQKRMNYVKAGFCPHKQLVVAEGEDYIPADVFITREDFMKYLPKMIDFVMLERFDGVLTVARSGLMAASFVAVQLHLPLYSVSPVSKTVSALGSGYRLGDAGNNLPKRPVLIDDTVYSGGSLLEAERIFRAHGFPIAGRAVMFAAPQGRKHVNFAAAIYEPPHYLEWCFMNCFWGDKMAYDFDGILCVDDAPNIVTAKPLYLPKMHEITVITARPRWTEEICRNWCQHYGLKVKELVLYEGDELLQDKVEIGKWKAQKIKDRPWINIFCESDPIISQTVAEAANIAVICPKVKKVYNQSRHDYRIW